MRNLFYLSLVTLLALVLWSCDQSDSTSTVLGATDTDLAADNAAIETLIAEDVDLPTEFRDFDGAMATRTDGKIELSEIATAINPVRFGRQITHRTVTYEIEYADRNHAHVVQTITVEGIFHILTADSLHIEKPFMDTGHRQFDVVRAGQAGDHRRGWRITAFSGMEFTTPDGAVDIVQMHLVAGDIDTTLTGVSDLVARQDILTLPPDTEVTLTVSTTHLNDLLFLHHRWWHRRAFETNDDGTYSLTWRTPRRAGVYHFTLDAISNGTLLDDQLPYAANGWGIPYRILP
ncbi:MAG: hypothetical protein D6675_10525 [Gemmatimonadetes bacterium]|nr:MAG: hypothetical protein D6675_10525 [Gemmatimonadota bacterium]